MAVLTEGNHSGEYIISEANGMRSREEGVLATGNVLEAGSVLGLITASGLYTEHDPAASDGSENAIAILWGGKDATTADTKCTITARDTEVAGDKLVYITGIIAGDKTDAIDSLKSVGIIVR